MKQLPHMTSPQFYIEGMQGLIKVHKVHPDWRAKILKCWRQVSWGVRGLQKTCFYVNSRRDSGYWEKEVKRLESNVIFCEASGRRTRGNISAKWKILVGMSMAWCFPENVPCSGIFCQIAVRVVVIGDYLQESVTYSWFYVFGKYMWGDITSFVALRYKN